MGQRKRLIEAVRANHGGANQVYMMVMAAILMRGAVTAVAWFAPPTHRISAHGTLDDALEWIEKHRSGVSTQLREMAGRVRSDSARRTRSAATG